MSITVQITGLDKLLAHFQRLGQAVRTEALGVALMSAAQPVVNSAQELCPVVTGTLRRSIHAELGSVEPDKATVLVGTDVVYARRIEWGFVGADSLGRVYHQGAQPYMRPAIDSNRDNVKTELNSALADQLRQA
jgi:HK97 gp10 family phage protein